GGPADTASVGFDFFAANSGNSATLTTARFSPTPANYRVRLDVAGAAFDASRTDTVFLEISLNGGGTWAVLDTMTNQGGTGVLSTVPATTTAFFPGSSADWTTLSHPLPTGTRWLRFRAVSDNGNNVYIDNVVVEATPNCTEPSGLTVSNITGSSAELGWTASTSNPAEGYQWEVRTSGVGGDPSPAFSGTTAAGVTAANVAGLMATTAYSLYVRSDCGSGSFSPWEGPEAFTTLLSI